MSCVNAVCTAHQVSYMCDSPINICEDCKIRNFKFMFLFVCSRLLFRPFMHQIRSVSTSSLANMKLVHFLTCSGLTRLKVSVSPLVASACWSVVFLVFSVVYFGAFCLYVATNFCPFGLLMLFQRATYCWDHTALRLQSNFI
jgi:hypothetical protein